MISLLQILRFARSGVRPLSRPRLFTPVYSCITRVPPVVLGRCIGSETRVRLQAAPQIPAGHCPVRPPRFAERVDFHRLRHFRHPVRFSDRVANSQIPTRQYVRALQRKDQEHVSRPDSDPLHLRQLLDHLLVGEASEFFEHHPAVARVPGQIANIGRLLTGKACRPHTNGP